MVPAASGVVGVRLAMVPAPLSATVAGTLAATPSVFLMIRRVARSTVFTYSLLFGSTVVLRGTLVAPVGGAWAVTVGATSVVKLHTKAVPSGVAMVSVTVPATVAV